VPEDEKSDAGECSQRKGDLKRAIDKGRGRTRNGSNDVMREGGDRDR